jgi:hypothetical protein
VPGKEDLTSFALEAGAHALRFFTDWFGIDYPAEKLDLVAIPDFAFGAMENLGCVTFREALLLVDPTRASRLELERIADVVSHEIAHMWFGDLVTMKWWTGIWLNEAFATLMELLCVDAFRPGWQRWVSFGMERDLAMATDSLHATRPVEYPVGSPEEAQGMFDVLTYQKGASVLRMLERYLGAEPFRAGIRRYLEAHRFGNTETADLWDAIEEASGEPVRDIMDTWILQGGFPLVTTTDSPAAPGRGSLTLSQEPFVFSASPGAERHRIGLAGSGPRALDGRSRERVPCSDPLPPISPWPGRTTTWSWSTPEPRASTVSATPPLISAASPTGSTRSPLWSASACSATPGPPSWPARTDLDDFLLLAESPGPRRGPRCLEPGDRAPCASSTTPSTTPPDRWWPPTPGRSWPRPSPALGWSPRRPRDARTGTLRAQLLGMLGTVGQDEEVRAGCARPSTPPHWPAGPRSTPIWPPPSSPWRPRRRTGAEFDTFLERLPAPGHTPGRVPLPLQPHRLPRPGAGRPDLRAGPHRGPHPERTLRRPAAPGPP